MSDNSSTTETEIDYVVYTGLEICVSLLAILGNLLVIIVFTAERRIRRLTNLYILSLAVSDLLVGLVGIPSAILTRLGYPKNAFVPCLAMLGMLLVLCTVSILNLLAVSVDRYWAILHPLAYHRLMSGRAVAGIIFACWILGTFLGCLPLFGWNNGPADDGECTFIPIMSYNFLVFIYFATIVYPAVMMAFFYGRIYLVVLKQLRQIAMIENQLNHSNNGSITTLNRCNSRNGHRSVSGSLSSSIRTIPPSCNSNPSGGSSAHHPNGRQVNRTSKKEVKKAKTLSIIVIVFMVCWVPLYTVNCVQAFCASCNLPQIILDTFIVLSHANSAVNPFLYAYHMRDFRDALKKHIFRVKPKVRGRGFELNSLSGHVVKANGLASSLSHTQPVVGCKTRGEQPRLSEVPEMVEAVSVSAADIKNNSDVSPVMENSTQLNCKQLSYDLVNEGFVKDDLDTGVGEWINRDSSSNDLDADSSVASTDFRKDSSGFTELCEMSIRRRVLHSFSFDNERLEKTDESVKATRRIVHSLSLDAHLCVIGPMGKDSALPIDFLSAHPSPILTSTNHIAGSNDLEYDWPVPSQGCIEYSNNHGSNGNISSEILNNNVIKHDDDQNIESDWSIVADSDCSFLTQSTEIINDSLSANQNLSSLDNLDPSLPRVETVTFFNSFQNNNEENKC